MTTIVGAYNRSAIAFAADSAATCTNPINPSNSKISNTADKIFSLSRKYPVAVAIYNSLDFYGITWETIFKLYRDNQLKDRYFPHLVDYANDFFSFLKRDIIPRIAPEDHIRTLYQAASRVKYACEDIARQNIQDKNLPYDYKNLFNELCHIYENHITNAQAEPHTTEFRNLERGVFDEKFEEVLNMVLEDYMKEADCPPNLKSLFADTVFEIIKSDSTTHHAATGLVFWGYGEDELFPSYYRYEASLTLNNLTKCTELDQCIIGKDCTSGIAPFAQTDVVETFLRSIDPNLYNDIINAIEWEISSFRDSISERLKELGVGDEILKELNEINIRETRIETFDETTTKYIRETYIQKLLDTVEFMEKRDLAEMVENLVKMTCLKRRITTDEESVGGPVDVAVISKGDGFVWIKRKQYFSAELNPSFFNNR